MLYEIFSMYRNGEVLPYALLAILSVGFIIIFEKFIILQFVYKINFEKFNTTIKKMLSANDMERARNFSRATSKTGLPMLTVKAVDTYENDPLRVRAIISEEGLRFFPRIRRRLSQLPNLAAAAVLIGAIAAVEGIWTSFTVVEGLELGVKSLAFSHGLAHALLPLAISLIAAVLLMLPFGILDAICWRLEAEIEHSICIILNILAPEMQPIFAGGGHDSSNSNNTNSSSTSNASTLPHASETVTSESFEPKKGEENEISPSGLQEVPDEEEII